MNKEAVKAALKQPAKAEKCLRSLAYFVKTFWEEVDANDLQWNWHMQVLCDELQRADELVFKRLPKEKDLIFNVPPGSTKTKIVSVLSTAWEFARAPWIKVFVGSYSDGAISGIADEIKMVMKSARYRQYFPNTVIRKDRDSLHNFKTYAKGEFFAFTVGGTLTSKHADILKVDDPLNPKMAASEADLKSTNDFFSKTLPSRKINKEVTLSVLTMQRLDIFDPSGTLLEKKKDSIRQICLPATDSALVKPEQYRKFYINGLLDPKRMSKAVLDEALIDLGSANYAAQYDQNPTPSGGYIWKKWFKEVPDHLWPDKKYFTSLSSDWDLAYTKEEVNAASAYITTGKIKNDIFIEDFDWAWLEYPELIKWIKSKQAPHYIEQKATGKSAKQSLHKEGVLAIEVPVPGGSDKVARAKMATPIAEAGFVFIRKSMADRLYNDSRQGILRFPRGKYKDAADVVAQALLRQRSGGKVSSHSGRGRSMEEDDFED